MAAMTYGFLCQTHVTGLRFVDHPPGFLQFLFSAGYICLTQGLCHRLSSDVMGDPQ